jgi:hypothetical protein
VTQELEQEIDGFHKIPRSLERLEVKPPITPEAYRTYQVGFCAKLTSISTIFFDSGKQPEAMARSRPILTQACWVRGAADAEKTWLLYPVFAKRWW